MRQENIGILRDWVNSESFKTNHIERKTNLSGENFIDYVSQRIPDDDDNDNLITFENGSSMFLTFDPEFFFSYHSGTPNMNVDEVDGFKKGKHSF